MVKKKHVQRDYLQMRHEACQIAAMGIRFIWYKRFDGILDKHNDQIGNLLNGLSAEVKAREKGEDVLSKAITG